MSLEKLIAVAESRAEDVIGKTIVRIAAISTPPGITAEAIDGGVALTGKRLRRRMIDDPQLRNYGK